MRERTDAPERETRGTCKNAVPGREIPPHITSRRRVGKRVMVVDEPYQPFLKHVGVDLGRRYVGMAEQLLDRSEIGAVLQQMAGKGMAQHVRRDLCRGNAGTRGQRLQIPCKNLTRQVAALGWRGKQI